MTPERWRRINELFHAALQQSPAGMEEFLRHACDGDAELFLEVWRMLQEEARTGPLDETILSPREPSSQPVFVNGGLIADRYRIIRFVNRGGMGEVYEAEDLELNERVALKTVLPAIGGDTQMIARLKQELQLSRRIGHVNVCRVFDLARHPVDGSGPTTYFFTMEFLPGETLAAKLHREGRLAPEQALPLLGQMAEALDAAHQAGVIHRDFKPSNVMLVPTGKTSRAVVTDFGLARKTATIDRSTATLTGTIMGTPEYMAPELLMGASASPASDIYALGLVAYKIVTGELPFSSPTASSVTNRHGKQLIPSACSQVPHLNSNWDRALSRALDPNPAQRFRTGRDFFKSLQSGNTASMTLQLPVMSRRQWTAVLLTVLVLIAGVVAWRIQLTLAARPSRETLSLYQTGVDDIHAGAYFAATRALNEAVRLTPNFSLAHARLAEAWIELDLQQRAQEEMVRAQREDNTGLREIDRLQIAAVSLTITREFDAAVQKYKQIQRIASADDAGILVDLGRAYVKAGKPGNAIEVFRRAAEGSAHNPAAWLSLGTLYARGADAAKSTQAFDQAERLYQITTNLEGLIEVAYERGVAAYRAGDLGASAAYYRKALETAHNAGNPHQEIRAKLQLSTSAYLSGDAATAEQYAREALEAAQNGQMETLAISGIVNLGNACAQKRDLVGAERNYQDALARARRNSADRMAALATISLAALHYAEDRYSDAAVEAQQALTYYQANRFAEESLKALTLLGRADYHRGHDGQAMESFRSLLALAEKAQNHPQMALAHENIGLVFSHQQRYPEALGEFRRNLELSTDDVHAGYARLQCGDVLWMLGRYEEAASMFDQAGPAAAKFSALKLGLTRARANMALSQNDFVKAAEQAKNGLGGKNNPGSEIGLKTVLGAALVGSGQKQAGLRLCEEALSAAELLKDEDILLDARLAVIKARVEAGQRDLALGLFHEAEPALGKFPESRWRALAIVSIADGQFLTQARQAMDQLAERWGAEVFRSYKERPDVKKLSWPLLAATNAIHY